MGNDGTTPSAQAFGGVPHPALPRDADIEPLLRMIRDKHGVAVQAILVYGSWLRGKRDTLLDFYVLVDDYDSLDSAWEGWLCRLLPPNVYHIRTAAGDDGAARELRAKYALLTLKRFRRAVRTDFHSYFWARFAQPCRVLYAREPAVSRALQEAFRDASAAFIGRVLPAMGDRFSSAELWTRGFALTYRCEIRTESRARGESLYAFNHEFFDHAVHAYASASAQLSPAEAGGGYRNRTRACARKLSMAGWWLRAVQGKILSVLRLSKAAFTFTQPLEYLLWKIERHSGVHIEPTERQLKHPLLFAWPLLWRLRKRGAFR